MVCPKCENRNFIRTADVARPLKNMGGKERFKTFDTRRYVCLQCGYSFMTQERFYREIEVHKNQLDLFGDRHERKQRSA